jgi:hypothetical protein
VSNHLREALGDLGISVGGGVLVAHGGAGRGVAEATHEFGEGRAGLGGEDGAGVAEVVPTEVLAAGRLTCRVVDLTRPLAKVDSDRGCRRGRGGRA